MAPHDTVPLLSDPDETVSRGRRLGDVGFAAAVAGLFGVLVVEVAPELLRGILLDTDSYMRLVRVELLAETGRWYDGTVPRSNAPFGEVLHWTRPVDVLLLLGAWILTPLFGFERALHLAGVFLSPVLLLATCFAVAWAVAPVAGRGMRYYAMIGVLAQVGIMGYAMPGRADHHLLLLLLFTAMCGATVRLLLGAPDAARGLAAGILAGAGVWVSTEFLVGVAVLLGTCGLLWVLEGHDRARRFVWVGVGLLTTVVAALLVERPPGDWTTAELDRVSIVHVWVGLLATLFWAAAAWWEGRTAEAARRASAPAPSGLPGRVLWAALGGVLALGATEALFPGFFGGPMGDVHPDLRRLWLPHLTEYQPFLVPHGPADVGRMVAYLGPALVALPVLVWRRAVDRGPGLGSVWVFLLVGLSAFVPLGIRWVRFVPYAEVLGLVVLIWLLERALSRIDERLHGVGRTAARVVASAGLLAGWLLGGGALMATGGQAGQAARDLAETQVAACASGPLMRALSEPAGLGSEPRTIVAHVDLGPELLYRTPHAVLATPYHRNAAGLLTGRAILASRDDGESRRVASERGVDWVLVCASGPGTSFYGGPQSPPTLYRRLAEGTPPVWLEAVPLPEQAGGYRLYAVR